MRVVAASWAGAIEVTLYVDSEGRDCYAICQLPWQGVGISQLLADGILGQGNLERAAEHEAGSQ